MTSNMITPGIMTLDLMTSNPMSHGVLPFHDCIIFDSRSMLIFEDYLLKLFKSHELISFGFHLFEWVFDNFHTPTMNNFMVVIYSVVYSSYVPFLTLYYFTLSFETRSHCIVVQAHLITSLKPVINQHGGIKIRGSN